MKQEVLITLRGSQSYGNEKPEVVELVTTLPQNLYDRQMLCFRTIWQDVDIYVDGELRQSYTTKDSRPFGTNSAMRYLFLELREEEVSSFLKRWKESNAILIVC